MDPVEQAAQAAQAANTIATWALVVSVLAALFTGWQALTTHLEHRRARSAALVMPRAEPGTPRTIKNEGGSAAHSVHIYVWGVPMGSARRRRHILRRMRRNQRPRIGEPVTGGKVSGSLPAGETAPIDGIGPQAAMFGPLGGGPGRSGLDILYSPGLATWVDRRGKQRLAWIEIR